jgi:hypothetical protein
MEREVLLLSSKEPATGLCSKPDESGPHSSILFPPDYFEIIPPPTPASSEWSLSFRFLHHNPVGFSLLPRACHMIRLFCPL